MRKVQEEKQRQTLKKEIKSGKEDKVEKKGEEEEEETQEEEEKEKKETETEAEAQPRAYTEKAKRKRRIFAQREKMWETMKETRRK